MRTRRRLWPVLPIAVLCAGAAVVACVGDDPAVTLVAAEDGGVGKDETGSEAAPGQDAAVDSPLPPPEDAAVNCSVVPPQLFTPIPGTGTFCQGAAGNHCAFGEHCCKDLVLNTQRCAATCEVGDIDVECANSTECGDAGICCGRGKVRTDACTYLVVEDLIATSCETSCNPVDFQLCGSNTECSDGGKTCTPARALTPDKKGTTTLQVSACR